MIFLLLLMLVSVVWAPPVEAIYDPLSVPNNRFGMHIADTNDIADVTPLVNSSGGDWGYITMVIQEDDRNHGKWLNIFNQLRRLHVIPILRLATHVQGSSWVQPDESKLKEWVSFLNELNWPVENRYVVLFNEPNHANEWGGALDPEGYARKAVTLAKLLKEASADFFILPAGLDVSAASDGASMDAENYLRRMVTGEPEFLSVIDGWTSHSYPNPGFAGSPYALGRGTLRSFEWELGLLSRLGVKKTLPVFITETGWYHSHGKFIYPRILSPETVATYIQAASSSVWQDSRIVAVTPFVFSYQDYPFDHFSWKKLGVAEYYPHYFSYQRIGKIAGMPRQREQYEVSSSDIPSVLVADSSYPLSIDIKNIGQGILDPGAGYTVTLSDAEEKFSSKMVDLPVLEPGQRGKMILALETPDDPGLFRVALVVQHNGINSTILEKDIAIVPPPSLRIKTQLGWRRLNDATNVRAIIYSMRDEVLHEARGLTISGGVVVVPRLTSVVPGTKYRVVVIAPYYLPRQAIVTVDAEESRLTLRRFLPLDFNNDGKLSLDDVPALIQLPPHTAMFLFFGR